MDKLENQKRVGYDCKDAGGRAMQGAIAEAIAVTHRSARSL
jgi:hypothetical protein